MIFATRFSPPSSSPLDFKGCPAITAQEFKEEADINFLLRRYKATGSLYTIDEMARAKARPMFGDFTGIPDYQTTLDKVNLALEQFQDLPLAVRQRFHDSPTEMLAFLQDVSNRDEAVKLGLVNPPAVADDKNEPSKTSDKKVNE